MTEQKPYQDIKIIKGPSREELFDALRLNSEERKVSFTIELRPRLPAGSQGQIANVIVQGIVAEDASGNNWLIRLLNPSGWYRMEGYFNTNTRTGWLKLV